MPKVDLDDYLRAFSLIVLCLIGCIVGAALALYVVKMNPVWFFGVSAVGLLLLGTITLGRCFHDD